MCSSTLCLSKGCHGICFISVFFIFLLFEVFTTKCSQNVLLVLVKSENMSKFHNSWSNGVLFIDRCFPDPVAPPAFTLMMQGYATSNVSGNIQHYSFIVLPTLSFEPKIQRLNAKLA